MAYVGGPNNDVFNGGSDNDTARGSGGDDTLSGGGGNDRLEGEDGSDILSGGAGADVFAFRELSVPAVDRILDFNAAEGDRIWLPNLEGRTTWWPGDQFFAFGGEVADGTLTLGTALPGPPVEEGYQLVLVYYSNSGGSTRLFVDANADRAVDALDIVIDFDGTIDFTTAMFDQDPFHTQFGTASGDTLTGTDQVESQWGPYGGQDILIGLDGNDTLTGLSGGDVLWGGAGDDFLDGGPGGGIGGVIHGGSGNDEILPDTESSVFGEDGNDLIRGSAQQVSGGNGNDRIVGGGHIDGDDGDDTLIGSVWTESVTGGAGDDVLITYSRTIYGRFDGGDGNDTIDYSVIDSGVTTTLPEAGNASNGADSVSLFSVENLIGSGFNDTLIGNDDNNVIEGGLGNDFLDGKGGIDTVSYAHAEDSIKVLLVNTGVNSTWGAGNDTIRNFENLIGSNFGDMLDGNDLANVIIGLGGGDSIYGRGGDDTLDGGAGDDRMVGGWGSDTYYVDNSDDVVFENDDGWVDRVYALASFELAANVENLELIGVASIDGTGNAFANVLAGNKGDNRLAGLGGNDLIDGGAGADRMEGGRGDDIYFVDDARDTVVEDAKAGTDRVYASASFELGAEVENLELTGIAGINGAGNGLANALIGNKGDNWLVGLGGNDLIDGGGGGDRMDGGLGDDTYFVNHASDRVNEKAGEGTDLVYAALTHKLGANVENLVLTGSGPLNGAGNALNNRITGNGGANWLAGREGDDVLDGEMGADRLEGGSGNDRYVVDHVGDVVVEAADGGADTVEAWVSHALAANVESLVLMGSAAIDGTGNALANKIFGNSAGNVLSGGAGADAFVFAAALGWSNVDTLADYEAADDSLLLDRTIFTGIAANGTLSASAFRAGTAAVDADDRVLYDAATGNIWYDADGVGGAAAVQFARVAVGLALTNADFFAVP